MKQIISLLVIPLLLYSCTEVKFKSLNSIKKGQHLYSFPESYRGHYISKGEDGDTIIINKFTLDLGYDAIDGEHVRDTIRQGIFEIIKFNNYLIICKNNNKYWDLIPTLKEGNEIKVYHFMDVDEYIDRNFPSIQDAEKREVKFYNAISKITKPEKIYDESGNLDFYVIDPTEEEFKLLLSKGFFSLVNNLKKSETP